MSITSEMNAFTAKVNTALLSDTVAFILSTAEPTVAQRLNLNRRCPMLDLENAVNFQSKYGFLYLGEMLERYEERFGMTDADFRAIGLALGYTQNMLTDAMFVNNQRGQFMQKLRRLSADDIYLKGALYLLNEGQSAAEPLAKDLIETLYTQTEELIFVLSLFGDIELVFRKLTPQLISLLGKGRTIPVLGNTWLYNLFICRIMPVIKTIKSKDMALFRALCSLPTSFVKSGSDPHATLAEHGYTPLDIAYANMLAVEFQTAPGVLKLSSLVTEKIVIALFLEALNHEAGFTEDQYSRLAKLYIRYSDFDIKCNGHKHLIDAVEDDAVIRNPKTFVWFNRLVKDHNNPVFGGFDLDESKWDELATDLDPERYMRLLELQFDGDKSTEDIRRLIGRYDSLTGLDYVKSYWNDNKGNCFSFLVNCGLIELWDGFETSLTEDGKVEKRNMLGNILNYIRKIKTLHAYRFIEKLIGRYGIQAVNTYFRTDDYNKLNLMDMLTEYSSYSSGSSMYLKIKRDILSKEEHINLLHWLEEYIFTFDTDKYLKFVVAVLTDEFASSLLPKSDLRRLFDLVICQSYVGHEKSELKDRYLTQEEKEAEKDAKTAAEKEQAVKRKLAEEEEVKSNYDKTFDGSFKSAMKFVGDYKFDDSKERFALGIIRKELSGILISKNNELDRQDAVQFLFACSKLVGKGVMPLPVAQNYISMIKEVAANDAENN